MAQLRTGPDGRSTTGRELAPFGRRLVDVLIAERHITPEQLSQAVAEQVRTEDKMVHVIVRLGLMAEDDLLAVLARQYRLPIVDVPDQMSDDLLRLVPAALAKKYEIFPVTRTPTTVTLAMIDPTNLSALDEVSFRTGLRVLPVLARPSMIRRHISRVYESSAATLADVLSLAEAEMARGQTNGREFEMQDLRASADQAPIVRLVNAILDEAIARGASDVHLDPTQATLRVRFRCDGMLIEAMAPPRHVEPAVVSRIKIIAGLDISERRLPQDGRIKHRYQSREIDFRVSVLPTIYGESVCMRVLDRNALKLNPRDLGFDAWSLAQFQKAVQSPNGVILITGPTGSGKTTTLYSALQTLNSPDVHIVTLEDPVEYNLAGINQVQVRDDVGFTFATALRAFLRHDPDVILVGEMRDVETAQMAIRAALTGHLVMSTLHTNSCPATIARLVDMGLPPFLIASALRLVVAQRLARTVCAECREPSEIDETSLAAYGHVPQGLGPVVVYAGKGCASCHFTGMRGRVAIYETMPVSPELNELVLANAPTTEIQRVARDQGMRTLREAGLLKVIEGAVTVEEILRVTAD
ncbi:MAG: Flp pilus assembly complex ATPase component TadA [Candidatus Rokubacteria bacterium]|nr:Flp pilus assembly complex ATPase component TadA [Candidatus Rokubacteria bacterium]